MSEKVNTSITLDEDVARWLELNTSNRSAKINDILRNYKENGRDNTEFLELRKDMLDGEINELESRLASKKAERSAVEQQLRDVEDTKEQLLDQAAEELQPHLLNENNPAVENWAENVGVEEQELIAVVEDRIPE